MLARGWVEENEAVEAPAVNVPIGSEVERERKSHFPFSFLPNTALV